MTFAQASQQSCLTRVSSGSWDSNFLLLPETDLESLPTSSVQRLFVSSVNVIVIVSSPFFTCTVELKVCLDEDYHWARYRRSGSDREASQGFPQKTLGLLCLSREDGSIQSLD